MEIQNVMTRAEAVEGLGEELVARLDGLNCEMTNRVGFNGACLGDDLIEWSASIDCNPALDATLTVYYYTDLDDEQQVVDAGEGDWSVIDFRAAGYDLH